MHQWRYFVGSLLTLLVLSTSNAIAQKANRAIIVSWDGAADWVVDKLLDEGKLPNVARLAAKGVRFDHCISAYPSKTACGHSAIWTGAWGDISGISGNSVPVLPRAEHTLLERRSGFLSDARRAEPLWIPAVKAGKRVVVISSTQSDPPTADLNALKAIGASADGFTSVNGFETRIEGGRVITDPVWKTASDWASLPEHKGKPLELSLKVGEQTFYLLAFDDPKRPTEGLDSVLIRQGSKQAGNDVPSSILYPSEAEDSIKHFSPAFRVTKDGLFGYTFFRLFELAPDGKKMVLYQRQTNGWRGAISQPDLEAYAKATGGFHDDPFFGVYEPGKLGKTLWQGGDGKAEARLLELVRFDVECVKRSFAFAWKHWNPHLLTHYTPMSDSAGHAFMGILDPTKPGHNPELASKLWNTYVKVFQIQDEWLGMMLDMAGDDTVVCLVSDHGMEGVAKSFSPNAVLKKAGLATFTANNRGLDLSRTKIATPPWGDYFISINGTDWKQGIVTPAEREEILQKATRALLAEVDPETGNSIVTRVFRPDDILGLGIGGEAGGDLYLDFAPGYVPTAAVRDEVLTLSNAPIGSGVHGFLPLRKKMQAICYIGGAGVKKGVVLPGIRQIDIAPTIATLLGIPAPKNAQGHIIGGVMSGQ